MQSEGPACTACGADVRGAPSAPASPGGAKPDLVQVGFRKGYALQALSCPALLCPAQACGHLLMLRGRG